MNKNTVYILQKDYESPMCKVHKGVGHTIKEWQRYFPKLSEEDFDIKSDWFKPTKEEPQWEILEFKNLRSGIVYIKKDNGKFNSGNGLDWDLETFDIKDHEIINSVKRFPDNTVWSVDMVTNNGRITGFHIEKGIMVAEFENNTRHCDLMLLIKAPKEEQVPIKVLGLLDGINTDNPPYGKYYTLIFNNSIPESKYQSIKEAIEGVLNDEITLEKRVESIARKYKWYPYQDQKLYTEEQLLQARRDAFDAAREIKYVNESFFNEHYEYLKNSFINCSKHKSYEDYINSLK